MPDTCLIKQQSSLAITTEARSIGYTLGGISIATGCTITNYLK